MNLVSALELNLADPRNYVAVQVVTILLTASNLEVVVIAVWTPEGWRNASSLYRGPA